MPSFVERLFLRSSNESKIQSIGEKFKKDILSQSGVRGITVERRGIVVLMDDDTQRPNMPEEYEGVRFYTQRVRPATLLATANGRK